MIDTINTHILFARPGDEARERNDDTYNPVQQTPPLKEVAEVTLHSMKLPLLIEHCTSELRKHQIGEFSNDQYGLELFSRALRHHDTFAWRAIQHCFNSLMLHWMSVHPMKELACRFDSEENYVAQGFARFWQTMAENQNVTFTTLAAALHYLHMSLNSAVIDTLRKYARPRLVPLSELHESRELSSDEHTNSDELWETLKSFLPDKREQRLAYLLFHCNLKPREIVHFCPQEFSNVQEIYQMSRLIMNRLLRNSDQLRWKLGA